MEGRSEAYRSLDSAALEELFLKRAVGLSPEDIAARRGSATPQRGRGDRRRPVGLLRRRVRHLRPTPIDQVRAVAAAGETMPPKSTYFFPKLLTGIAFNPLTGRVRAGYMVGPW